MKYSFLKDFRMAPTTGPIASEAVRFELHAAIRTGDPAMFRETLARVAPELAGERRLFCIFEK